MVNILVLIRVGSDEEKEIRMEKVLLLSRCVVGGSKESEKVAFV